MAFKPVIAFAAGAV